MRPFTNLLDYIVHLSLILLDTMMCFQMLLFEVSLILSYAFPSDLLTPLYMAVFEPFEGGKTAVQPAAVLLAAHSEKGENKAVIRVLNPL